MPLIYDLWGQIQPKLKKGGVPVGAKAAGFLYPWNHDVLNMEMMCHFLHEMKPTRVLELGTFEGLGTDRMANTLEHVYLKKGPVKLATIDVGVGPVDVLGPTYGVTKDKIKENREGVKIIDFEKFDDKTIPDFQRSWTSFAEVIKNRNDIVRKRRLGVQVRYFEGASHQMIPVAVEWLGGEWDFCFQDTIHHVPYILREWMKLKKTAHVGSVIVFDDAVIFKGEGVGKDLMDWFKVHEPDWVLKHTPIGHQQLWAEKIQ